MSNKRKRIDDYWNIDGSRDLSDPWTGFTQLRYWKNNLLMDMCGPGGRLTRKQLTSRPDYFMARTLDEMGKKCPAEGEAKVV